MKKFVLMLFIFAGLSACNQNKEAAPDDEPVFENSDTTDRMFSRDDVEREQDAVATDTAGIYQTPPNNDIVGTYQLVRPDGSDGCNCDCLEISFDEERDLCLVEDEVTIRVRYERTGDSIINMFFVEPADVENAEQNFPWNEFDRNTPIATLDLQPNETVVLEWQGFARNGQISEEHTNYGKQNLEGTYAKQN